MFKVTKAQGSKTDTSSTIDLFSDLSVSRATKREIQKDVGDFLKEQILSKVGDAQSPINGERWPALSARYKALKKAEGGTPQANMELTGKMLDELDWRPSEDGIKIGVFGDKAWQADGHNHFSSASDGATAPQRRFLPGEGQMFDSEIQSEIERIVSDKLVEAEDFSKSDFSDIETKSQLYGYFREKFGDMSRSEITSLILRNKGLVDLLDGLDLLGLLD